MGVAVPRCSVFSLRRDQNANDAPWNRQTEQAGHRFAEKPEDRYEPDLAEQAGNSAPADEAIGICRLVRAAPLSASLHKRSGRCELQGWKRII